MNGRLSEHPGGGVVVFADG
ncbi:H-X9-DG-CTERM domain-containing protein [Pseudomonas sp. MEJ086]